MQLKGSKTEANLMAAFAGESQARTKYTIFSAQAAKEGYQQIAGIFSDTADNERAHAKVWYETLHGGIGNTENNLMDAAAGETYEFSKMYPSFADIAKEEGFDEIATLFKEMGEIEETHKERFEALLKNVETGMVFMKDEPVTWKCGNCGYIHTAKEAPAVCPACGYPQGYFAMVCKNY